METTNINFRRYERRLEISRRNINWNRISKTNLRILQKQNSAEKKIKIAEKIKMRKFHNIRIEMIISHFNIY